MVARLAVTLPTSRKVLVLLLILFHTVFVRIQAESDSSEASEVPRGIYHFSDTDRDIAASFKIPDFEALDPIKVASDLMSSAMKVDTKRKTLAGIEMPFSLTGRPMSLQINGESHDAVSLVDDPKKRDEKKTSSAEVRRSDMTPESRKAFLRARQVCLEQSADSCDEALDTFHRVRYGKSLLMGGDGDDDDEQEPLRTTIERRLKQTASTSSASPPYSESQDDVEEEREEEEEEDEEDDDEENRRRSEQTKKQETHRFSHITLPKYHDKAHSFLRDIN